MLVQITLAGACAALGLGLAARLRARCARLRAWQRALSAMYAACAYLRADGSQILRAGAAEVAVLQPVARAVELQGASAERLFEAQVLEPLLRPEERRVLLSAMHALAEDDRRAIADSMAFAQERFRQFCADSEEKRDTDARLYVTLGVLSGLCVFLILW